ncbi:STAS domain-containing protein [Peribacillus glennii]|uniref:STAS domain-containing protein n=1 Tax=Peribacillus glennii TaxID=2303991 RepID=A0A372LFX6_9BACI|nr:STAS domain-containing protein [Peribacillus glennii]RFU64914.1 STAS domain-containing protein [Peribacillus glennii]
METKTVKKELIDITKKVMEKKEELAQQRQDAVTDDRSEKTINALTSWRENLIEIYAQSISEDLEITYGHLKKWGDHIVNLLVNLQLPLDVAIEEIRFYRDTIGQIIKEEANAYQFTIDEFYEVLSRFDSVVDRAVHWLSLSYLRSHTAQMLAAEDTLRELTIPVVRVTEQIGVLPIVGDIDTKRAQQLMDTALAQGTLLNLSYLIIDLSGVPIIDTLVADQIFKVITALKLVGIETKLTGIRPEIAQTMVNLGVSFQDVYTFSSLHQAIAHLNGL